jgi:hypothetical protein
VVKPLIRHDGVYIPVGAILVLHKFMFRFLFAEAIKKADILYVDGIRLPVVSIEHLIKMKEKTGREKDKLDVHELKEIKKLKGAR